MSLIGSLEQFSLSNVLQRIESFAKTGLLVVKQEEKWVELSFRQGQLMCIGPVRSSRTLGERLLQAGIISQEAFREVARVLGSFLRSETRTASTLVDLGYLNQESLFTWAATEASRVIQALLTWTTGEIYFEEGMQPPADRLLIVLSVTSLLSQQPVASTPQPVGPGISSTVRQARSNSRATAIADVATLHDASQFFDAAAVSSVLASVSSFEGLKADVASNTDALPSFAAPLSQPQRVTEPLAPRRIDTSFMQPHMILTPTDLSGLREWNPQVQLTPEQWRLFTRVDGQTSLQATCQALGIPRELVCQVAGELIALGLVNISMPASGSTNEASNLQGFMSAGLSSNNGINFSAPAPIETLSQWGNGGNGATFVLGGGWVVSSSPSPSLQSTGSYNLNSKVYAQVR